MPSEVLRVAIKHAAITAESAAAAGPSTMITATTPVNDVTASHATRHTSHATRHTSHVTRHTSHVTRHTSHCDNTSPEASIIVGTKRGRTSPEFPAKTIEKFSTKANKTAVLGASPNTLRAKRSKKRWTHVTPHTSHLTPHTSHLTPHTSHITRHPSHVTPVTAIEIGAGRRRRAAVAIVTPDVLPPAVPVIPVPCRE